MKYDNRAKISFDKCKDCKFCKRVDRWNIKCCHEKWKKSEVWAGSSPLMGNSTLACGDFIARK